MILFHPPKTNLIWHFPRRKWRSLLLLIILFFPKSPFVLLLSCVSLLYSALDRPLVSDYFVSASFSLPLVRLLHTNLWEKHYITQRLFLGIFNGRRHVTANPPIRCTAAWSRGCRWSKWNKTATERESVGNLSGRSQNGPSSYFGSNLTFFHLKKVEDFVTI